MPNNSVAILFAAPIRNRSNDVNFEYHQGPNFYYLTGLQEPNSVLLVFKNPTLINDSVAVNELIVIQKRVPEIETWLGRRLGVAGVKKLGFEHITINIEFPELDIDFSNLNKVLALKWNNDVRDNDRHRGDLYSLHNHFLKKLPNDSILEDVSLNEMLSSLREIKSEAELAQMQKAIDITCDAQINVMKNIKNLTHEYQVEALIEHQFKHSGAEYPGFPSIVGNGENSCILHYVTSRKKLEDSTLTVVDIGAEYHNYTADVTRTIPVNGKFTEEQKIIYNIVLEASKRALKSCKKGEFFSQPHKNAAGYIKQELHKLRITNDSTDYRKYFNHSTSHYLGLDVHDAGLNGKLKPGQVITVEPGIYIPAGSDCDPKWWDIGVRIEDDILITEGEPKNLSEKAPVTVQEIEELMR
jgi:Xaa-Pro aminopeptidase